MEQNGTGKKPFKKNYHKNNYKKKRPKIETESVDFQPLDKAKDYGISRELMESGKSRRRVPFDYSGSSGLIESFESEETKKDNRKPEKQASKPVDKKADKQDGKKFDKQTDKKTEKQPNRKKSANKGKSQKNQDRYTCDTDSAIKTKSNRQYIPVEYSDDDIIPDDFYFSDIEEAQGRRDNHQRSADKIRRDMATPGAVVGRNAVRELLRSDRSVDKLYVKSGSREGSIVVIVAEAVSRKIPIVEVSQDKLDQLSGGANHQGVVALAAEKQYTDIETILQIAKDRGEMPLVVVADGIEDPQNLGALIRCAECAGAHGIIIPKRRAVGLTPAVTKASAGAIEHMAIAKVSNLADALEKLKKAGLWVFAAEAGGTPYYEADFKVPAAIVLGSEGFGVGRLIKEKSDFMISIPMYGNVNSLNVATAASVILCHAARIHHS